MNENSQSANDDRQKSECFLLQCGTQRHFDASYHFLLSCPDRCPKIMGFIRSFYFCVPLLIFISLQALLQIIRSFLSCSRSRMINIVLCSYVMLVQSRRANLAHHQELLDLLEQQIFSGFYKKVCDSRSLKKVILSFPQENIAICNLQ